MATLKGEYDLIIHCAATRGGGVDGYRAVYLEGCRNLLARFSNTPIIFTSSTSVYGQRDHSEVSETSPANPLSETSGILLEAEQLVLAVGGVAIRLSALCGPGRCYTLKSILNGTARIDASGERILNFVDRQDVATACALIYQNWQQAKGECFNVSAVSLTQIDCYSVLAAHYGMPLPPMAQPGQGTRRRGDSSKIVRSDKIKNLGWQPHSDDMLALARVSE